MSAETYETEESLEYYILSELGEFSLEDIAEAKQKMETTWT